MQLHPKVSLLRMKQMGKPRPEYFLHVVTPCRHSNCRAGGHYPLPEGLDASGHFNVGLKIVEDPAIVRYEYETPVVHTVHLGPLPFPEREGQIRVNVFLEDGVQARAEKKPAGSATVSPTNADDGSRPGDKKRPTEA